VLLGFSTFIFLISPNLAKYTYEGLPLEQHPKIEKACGRGQTMNEEAAPSPTNANPTETLKP
jgi:hypothetical protein